MIHEIPVFGPPLAGKRSFLVAAGSVTGTHGQSIESTLQTFDGFNGLSVILFEIQLAHSGDSMRLWCISGGCDPGWPLQFVKRPSAALFVADAQQSRHKANGEFWQAVSDVVGIDHWFVVLTKCDLTKRADQLQALPPELRTRPHIRVAGSGGRAVGGTAHAFLTDAVFPSFAQGG